MWEKGKADRCCWCELKGKRMRVEVVKEENEINCHPRSGWMEKCCPRSGWTKESLPRVWLDEEGLLGEGVLPGLLAGMLGVNIVVD